METNQLTVCSTQIIDQATDTLAIDVDPMPMIDGTILCSQQPRSEEGVLLKCFSLQDLDLAATVL